MIWPWKAAKRIRELESALMEARHALKKQERLIEDLEGLCQRQQEEAIRAAKGST